MGEAALNTIRRVFELQTMFYYGTSIHATCVYGGMCLDRVGSMVVGVLIYIICRAVYRVVS